MPIKSKAQEKWLAANHPDWLHEWFEATPNPKSLPEKVSKKTPKKEK